MKVLVPGALRSYTDAAQVEAAGATLLALFVDLDRRYPVSYTHLRAHET